MEWSESLLDKVNKPNLISGLKLRGQPGILTQIEQMLTGAFPHTLIKGAPGMGKTHLAMWISQELAMPLDHNVCPIPPQELPIASIVLLDEAHLQSHPEWIFEQMGGARVVIAATTQPDKMELAFRSRFFLQLTMETYGIDALTDIVLDEMPEIRPSTAKMLARAAAGNPRQAHRLVDTAKRLGTDDVETILRTTRITVDGITEDQIRYVLALNKIGRPVGLEQLESMLFENKQLIRFNERYLIDKGIVTLSSSGRMLTRLGRAYAKALG